MQKLGSINASTRLGIFTNFKQKIPLNPQTLNTPQLMQKPARRHTN